jgi:hypothetical protein
MTRRALAIVLALTLDARLVHAQETVLTINVASADVYKGPSNVYPVIGHASRGAVLPIARNLGSWVKVAWPDAPDGIGYVHVTMGRIAAASGGAPAANAANSASSHASSAPVATTAPPVRTTAAATVPRPHVNVVTPASHVLGVGGLIGSMSTFGASARAWRSNHLGLQVGLTRDAVASDLAADRVTALQIEPGVVYAFFDRVSDYVWIRPYVGSAVSFRHQTLTVGAPGAAASASDSGIGVRLFAGSELTFASAPQLGLSVDFGYRRVPTPFPGFEADPLSVSIAAHWYFK